VLECRQQTNLAVKLEFQKLGRSQQRRQANESDERNSTSRACLLLKRKPQPVSCLPPFRVIGASAPSLSFPMVVPMRICHADNRCHFYQLAGLTQMSLSVSELLCLLSVRLKQKLGRLNLIPRCHPVCVSSRVCFEAQSLGTSVRAIRSRLSRCMDLPNLLHLLERVRREGST
jgi:hypothetical protein